MSNAKKKWEYDETLLSEMQESIQQALNALRAKQGHLEDANDALLQLLDATGVIYFMGAAADCNWREELCSKEHGFLNKLQTAAQHFLRWQRGLSLQEAGDFLMDNAPRLAAGEQLESLAEELLDALSVRHHLELFLEGARYLLDQEQLPEVGDDLLLSWSTFDGNLEAILWKLTPLNPQRELRVAWVAPTHRARLWWYSHGADLPATSIDAMLTTARMLAAFPEAEGALKDMLFQERQLQDALAAPADRWFCRECFAEQQWEQSSGSCSCCGSTAVEPC